MNLHRFRRSRPMVSVSAAVISTAMQLVVSAPVTSSCVG